ncbi:MAG TPA: DMT family transporter [Methylophilaceae bacterium]|nr:DMT family transporter [Methylophilaceae bacterium]
MKDGLFKTGVPAALCAALLFGAGAPLAKLLLNNVSPWMMAGLLYLGSGIGLTIYRMISRARPVRLKRVENMWFAGAIIAGGILAPVLLMWGLVSMPASGVSLLLNTEAVFTAILAWFVFKENFDRRIALGMAFIVSGALILSWSNDLSFTGSWPALAILAACLAWAIDNNLTRKLALADATWIASIKGLVAGSANLLLAILLGTTLPSLANIAGAMTIGFFAYGVSLTLFIVGLRHLGTARTGAYFSVALFCGAILAVAMGEPVTTPLLIAGGLMAIGVWLHLTEQHEHPHKHTALAHEHEHTHDEHHQHTHPDRVYADAKHSHWHQHKEMQHAHTHFPDAHHRHQH